MKQYLNDYLNKIDQVSPDLQETHLPPIDINQQSMVKEDVQKKEQIAIQEQKEKANQERHQKKIKIKDNPEWDIYRERIFIKTMLHQRFNYFIIIYALTILSAAIVSIKIMQAIILVTGLFILSMLWFNLIRVYIEFQEIYHIFHKTINSNNVLNIIEQKLNERQSLLSQLPMNSVLAYAIPALCLVSLLCYLVILLTMV